LQLVVPFRQQPRQQGIWAMVALMMTKMQHQKQLPLSKT
jgi:hypothetical protein